MKIILIVTRQEPELIQLGIPEGKGYGIYEENNKHIIGVLGGNTTWANKHFPKTVLPILNSMSGEIIILHHNSEYSSLCKAIENNQQLTLIQEVNCASTENNNEVNPLDREYYEELSEKKWDKFDAAWKHFSQIDPHELALRRLHNILSGNEMLVVDGEQKLVRYDNENEAHRIALSILRDKLLTP